MVGNPLNWCFNNRVTIRINVDNLATLWVCRVGHFYQAVWRTCGNVTITLDLDGAIRINSQVSVNGLIAGLSLEEPQFITSSVASVGVSRIALDGRHNHISK